MSKPRWKVAAASLIPLLGVAVSAAAAPKPAAPDTGAALYVDGVLASGQPLLGTRDAGEPLVGVQAACANCHRRSGLGSQEARSVIPPITAQFLFHPQTGTPAEIALPFVPGARPDRMTYTAETLARAIREGIDPSGRQLSYLMPRYALGDADMAALVAHLHALDRRHVPGVSDTDLQFATIITPDTDPARRRAMLDVLDNFFADRNNTQRLPSAQNMIPSGNALYVKKMFKVTRHWNLHVWELTGPAESWQEQLEKHFAAQPVFAVLSGLGGSNWAPVQQFCEQAQLPCLFPNVDAVPRDADRGFYSLYFTRGVGLEADLIAQALGSAAPTVPPLRQVHQVFREGDVGAGAAAALAAALKDGPARVTQSVLPAGAGAGSIASALRALPADTAVVLWLRPADLAELPALPAGAIYVSGTMGNVDAAPLPEAWRARAHIAYPFDLPQSRRVRLDYPLGWFRVRKIPVVDERLQADTWLACGLASETIKHMVDTFVPEYLVERLEDTAEHRIITGYYPRLSLAPHQRFASKGGFLVHATPGLAQWVPEGPWVSP
jgi:hypothetical protein